MSRSVAVLMALCAAITAAHAESVAVPARIAWKAPHGCPLRAEVQARIEARLGAPLDGTTAVTITVRRSGKRLAGTVTVGTDPPRTLSSQRCDQLADGIALVVARRMRERRADLEAVDSLDLVVEDAPTWADPALLATSAPVRESPFVAAPAQRDRAPGGIADPTASAWGGGLRALAVSGVGALPGIGVAGEVALFARRRTAFAELAGVRWAKSARDGDASVPGNVELGLETLALRAGWVPEHTHIRGWGTVEGGRITGTSSDREDMGSARWIAVGAGAAVAWPMARHARLVGTFEVVVALAREPYMLANGSEVHRPAVGSARCALGLELGWW